MVERDIPDVPDGSEIPEEPNIPEEPDIPGPSKVHRRFIVEFQDFDNLTKQHVEMLLATFEIKSVSYNYVQKLRQSTPFIEQLLPWDLIWDRLSNITDLKSVRFGALNPALTRRDLEGLQDRARDLSKLYAPTRFVAFEFDVPESIVENDVIETIDSLDADSINEARLPERPWAKGTKLEKLPVKPPTKPTPPELEIAEQDFMLSAPQGIGAYDVWDAPGGTGHGVRYVDIEYGWQLNHRDLPYDVQDPYDGTYSYKIEGGPAEDHGTGMLGIISAKHDDRDTYGIAPKASAYVLSQLRDRNLVNLPGSIELACAKILRPGDVLLIEAQTTRDDDAFMPVELEAEVFAAIEFGVNLGITIIEPAGNSSVDLDVDATFPHQGDSGAILVAASMKDNTGALVRWQGEEGTNFGGRVNCFAWGGVLGSLTSDSGAFSKTDEGGTSAASAIIAGTAILVQSLYKARFKDDSVIWPEQMRRYLTDPSGTRASAGQNIGIMPNLAQIYANLNTSATIPDKADAPQSLQDAVPESGVATGAGQTSIPRLVTFGSYALMTTAIMPAAPAGRAGNRIRALLSRWRRRRLAQP